MKVKIESEFIQSCSTLRNPMDCSLPGSSAHGIFQASVLEWGAIAFSREDHSLDNMDFFFFFGRVMSLLFNTLSRFVITFLPRSNHLLISWLQSPSTLILKPKNRKSVTNYNFSPPIFHVVMELDARILVFLIFSLKSTLPLSCYIIIKRFLVPLHFLPLE